MSIFASQTVSGPIPIPFDPPHTITVRKLTGRELEAAQEAHRGSIATGSTRAWAAAFRRMLETGAETGASDPEVAQVLADPLTGYDRYALVRSGLVAWSYPQAVTPVRAKAEVKARGAIPGSPAVEASDAVEDLDDEAVDFIAREVLRLTKPALFDATPADVAAQKKSG